MICTVLYNYLIVKHKMRDLHLAIVNKLCTHITGWAKQSIFDISVVVYEMSYNEINTLTSNIRSHWEILNFSLDKLTLLSLGHTTRPPFDICYIDVTLTVVNIIH